MVSSKQRKIAITAGLGIALAIGGTAALPSIAAAADQPATGTVENVDGAPTGGESDSIPAVEGDVPGSSEGNDSTSVAENNAVSVTTPDGTATAEYSSLPEAVQHASDGATITLLKDTKLDSCLTINKQITLDGQGKQLNGSLLFGTQACGSTIEGVNFRMDSTTAVSNWACNLYIDTNDVTVSGNTFTMTKDSPTKSNKAMAIYVFPSANSSANNLIITNNDFYIDDSGSYNIGISLSNEISGSLGIDNATVSGNTLHAYPQADSSVATFLVAFGKYNNTHVDGLTIQDNKIAEGGTSRAGLPVQFWGGVTNANITGNTFGAGQVGIYFNADCRWNGTPDKQTNISISDNTFSTQYAYFNSPDNPTGNTYSGFDLTQIASNLNISNNTYLTGCTPFVGNFSDGASAFTVTVYDGTGSCLSTDILSANDAASYRTPAAPTRPGYSFNGWSDGTKVYPAGTPISLTGTGNLSLTAQWSKNIIIPPTGGGSSSTTETVTNGDGSKTTTVTHSDGSKTETTVSADKSVSTVVKTGKDGTIDSIEAKVTGDTAPSSTVKLPMGPIASDTPIDVTAPAGTKVSIPVKDVDSSCVLVVVGKNGDETILPKTAITDDTLSAELSGACTLKIENRKAEFPDLTGDEWYAKSGVADFAASRNILTGVTMPDGTSEFQGDTITSRAMFVTMLNRLEMEPQPDSLHSAPADVPDGVWYESPAAWGFEQGIVSGYDDGTFGGGDAVTREQVAVFLMRYAKWLGLDTSARAGIDFPDGDETSDWAKDAVSWAVAEGFLKGDNQTGMLNPTGDATRAETATVLMRFIESLY